MVIINTGTHGTIRYIYTLTHKLYMTLICSAKKFCVLYETIFVWSRGADSATYTCLVWLDVFICLVCDADSGASGCMFMVIYSLFEGVIGVCNCAGESCVG